MPFDARKILEPAEPPTPTDGGLPAWLHESWADPDGFALALAPVHAGRGAAVKSRAGQHHDFFHDMVGRHAQTDRVALRSYERPRGWQQLTYRQLFDQATRRAGAWAQQGVKPGARVCLLLHPGAELLVSMSAALSLGACISFLPPVGRSFVARRLAALAPEHIAAEPHHAPLLGALDKRLLRPAAASSPSCASHTYKPGERVALLFSPLAVPSERPVPLRADDAWRSALVDGLLTFGLEPGDALAAPGFHPLQHLPALLFTTLLRGATYVHCELADVEAAPSLLTEHPLRALGVSPALRDLLLRTRTPLKSVGSWFRSPEAPLDWELWRTWVKLCGLGQVPSANVLIDAAAGGAVLSSPRRVGDVHLEAAPAPGRRWALQDLNRSGQAAAGDTGLLALLPAKERPAPYVVLSRQRGRYQYGGTSSPRREGRVYPSEEVCAAVEGVPSLLAATVLSVSAGGEPRRVLLGFTGGSTASATEVTAEIRRRVELQLGLEFLPDRVELFALHPRRVKGKLDEAWCQSQYLTGALHRKSSDPLFQSLTALRAHASEEAGTTRPPPP